MTILKRLILIAFSSCIISCATLFTGTSDDVDVSVTDCARASCTASNPQGSWKLATVPGTVEVQKDSAALVVACSADGNEPVAKSFPAKIEGWTWANILLGGLIGLAVDFASDGIHNYPKKVEVPMNCPAEIPEEALST